MYIALRGLLFAVKNKQTLGGPAFAMMQQRPCCIYLTSTQITRIFILKPRVRSGWITFV